MNSKKNGKKTLKVSLCVIAVAVIGMVLSIASTEILPASLMVNGTDYSGEFTGYSWKDEDAGVLLEDAQEFIETRLILDENGVIEDVYINFLVNTDGEWSSRVFDEPMVSVDFEKEPSIATLPSEESEYQSGESMFTISANDKMALYAVSVDDNGTVAFMIIDPFIRYQLEYKMSSDFDFDTKISDMTIGNGLVVPTTRASTSAMIKPETWNDFEDSHLLNLYKNTNAITGRGVFDGLDKNSTIKEFLECIGVEFEAGIPVSKEITTGRYGNGGWIGNYDSIASELIGKSAFESNSLINWNGLKGYKYRQGIDENNFFGIDAISSATVTVQNSVDTISGATVRISRESTSYQRALVEAGILTEEQVIIGRF